MPGLSCCHRWTLTHRLYKNDVLAAILVCDIMNIIRLESPQPLSSTVLLSKTLHEDLHHEYVLTQCDNWHRELNDMDLELYQLGRELLQERLRKQEAEGKLEIIEIWKRHKRRERMTDDTSSLPNWNSAPSPATARAPEKPTPRWALQREQKGAS